MPAVDISILGDKALERKLARLADKAQKKVVRRAMRDSAKRAHKRIIANINRLDLIDDGTMLRAFEGVKITSQSRNPRKLIRLGPKWPERDVLGIHANDKYYYPMAVEAGHPGAQANPFVRPAIDENAQAERREIGRDIGRGIEREAKR